MKCAPPAHLQLRPEPQDSRLFMHGLRILHSLPRRRRRWAVPHLLPTDECAQSFSSYYYSLLLLTTIYSLLITHYYVLLLRTITTYYYYVLLILATPTTYYYAQLAFPADERAQDFPRELRNKPQRTPG